MTGQPRAAGNTGPRDGEDGGAGLSWRAAAWNVLCSAVAYRRYLLTFVAGGLVGALLWSIGAQGLPFRKPYDPDNGDLFILSGQDLSDARKNRIDAWNNWVEQWNATHPDKRSHKAKARVIWLPGSPEQQHAEMLRRVQDTSTSSSAMADVLVLDTPWTRQFATADYIRPIGWEVDESGFLPKPLQTCKVDGTLYALPFNTDVGLLFSSAGDQAPPNRAAMFASARATGPAVFAGQFGPGETFVVNVIEAVTALGGEEIVGIDGRLHLEHPQVRDALRQLAAEVRDPTRMLPESMTSDEETIEEIFQAKPPRVHYMRNWTTYTYRLAKALNDSAESGVEATDSLPEQAVDAPALKAASRLPWASVLGGQNLAITRKSRSPQAAAELVEWLTGEASQTRLFEEGGFAPTRATVYADPTLIEAYPYASLLLPIIDTAILRPDVVNYPLLSQVFQTVVRDALTNGQDLTKDQLERITMAQDGKVPS